MEVKVNKCKNELILIDGCQKEAPHKHKLSTSYSSNNLS